MKKNILKKIFPILMVFILTLIIVTSCKKHCTCYFDRDGISGHYGIAREGEGSESGIITTAEECSNYFASLNDSTVSRCDWE
jgi:hypothetical protein